MKKLLAMALTTIALAACGQADEAPAVDNNETTGAPAETTDLGPIAVVMREEGSGSRGVFEEILGVNQEESGEDAVTDAAIIGQGNGGVATFVDTNEAAIGYVSFATLEQDNNLFGLSIDGVEPTHANVLAGDFPMARPFVVIYDDAEIDDIARAFLVFMQSQEGLAALEEAGTIPDTAGAEPFDVAEFSDLSGTLVLGGSTSVERAATTLADLFTALLPNITFSFNAAGSGAGINGAQDGTFALGFSSRAIRDTDEIGETVNYFVMTMDGLAIVTNEANAVTNVTLDQLRAIYLGEIADWSELD